MEAPLAILIAASAADAGSLVHALRDDGIACHYQQVETEQGYLLHLAASPDIILADCSLAQCTASRALRLLQDQSRAIPFIVIADAGDEEAALACMRQGAIDYLFRDRPGRLGQAVQRAWRESQASRQQRFQSHLLDTIGQAVVVTDRNNNVLYWNKAAETLYGWTAAEALGRCVLELVPILGELERSKEAITRLQNSAGESGEFVLQRRDGMGIPVRFVTAPLYDETGAVAGLVGVSTDISERRHAEEELAHERDL